MVTRGSVCWVDLDKSRPCVVVSSQEVLGVDVRQTHVVPLTSNLDRAGLAGNVLLKSPRHELDDRIPCSRWRLRSREAGPSVMSILRVGVAWSGSTAWGTARTFV